MLRKRVLGSHKKQVTTVVNFSLPTHERGRGETLVENMVNNPQAPVEWYGGGHRENVQLTGKDDAVDYLKAHGGDVPFGFD